VRSQNNEVVDFQAELLGGVKGDFEEGFNPDEQICNGLPRFSWQRADGPLRQETTSPGYHVRS
jgi:hypothetical protein